MHHWETFIGMMFIVDVYFLNISACTANWSIKLKLATSYSPRVKITPCPLLLSHIAIVVIFHKFSKCFLVELVGVWGEYLSFTSSWTSQEAADIWGAAQIFSQKSNFKLIRSFQKCSVDTINSACCRWTFCVCNNLSDSKDRSSQSFFMFKFCCERCSLHIFEYIWRHTLVWVSSCNVRWCF